MAVSGVAAVLLAAGESSRMGRPKQLLEWCGMPLIEYQVRELERAGVEEIVVVLGHRAEEFRPLCEGAVRGSKLRVVVNPRYREGKTGSIRTGLSAVGAEPRAILIQAVDQPRPARLLRRLLEEHAASEGLISLPRCGKTRGHPPVFDISLLPELLAVSEENAGLREVIRRDSERVREVDFRSPEVLIDLNRPEDYRRAREGESRPRNAGEGEAPAERD